MGSPESPQSNSDSENRDSVVNCDSVVVFFARGSEQPRKDHDAEEQAARDDNRIQLEVIQLYVLVASVRVRKLSSGML